MFARVLSLVLLLALALPVRAEETPDDAFDRRAELIGRAWFGSRLEQCRRRTASLVVDVGMGPLTTGGGRSPGL